MSRLHDIGAHLDRCARPFGPWTDTIRALVAAVEGVKAIAEAEIADPWSYETEHLAKSLRKQLAPLTEDG